MFVHRCYIHNFVHRYASEYEQQTELYSWMSWSNDHSYYFYPNEKKEEEKETQYKISIMHSYYTYSFFNVP